MSISFSGLASGLDTSSWVESLVALKRAKVTTLEEEKSGIELTQSTLSSIKSFFSSFRSMLEKVTDTKLGIPSMDLFAQNLANSTNLDILSAITDTNAKEATYNILVDKLATNTEVFSNYVTTYTRTTTADNSSKLTDLGLHIKDGGSTFGVTVDGIERGISITKYDTIATLTQKFNDIGVEAYYNETTGIFSVNVDDNSINDEIDHTGIVSALHLTGVNEGYLTDTIKISQTETVYHAATGETTLGDLGYENTGDNKLQVKANDKTYTVTATSATTMSDFINALKACNINAELDATGVFTVEDAEFVTTGAQGTVGTNICNAFGLSVDIFESTQSTNRLTHTVQVTSVTVANTDTLIKDLGEGVTINSLNNQLTVVNSDNITTTVTLTNATKIGDVLSALKNAGLSAEISSDGQISVAGGRISGGILEALGLEEEPFSAMVTGNALTETVVVHKTATLETTLVDDLKVTEGYLKVTKPDGSIFYEKIASGQTIADFMADMGNLGINTSLDEDSGVLTITGGAFETLSDADVADLIRQGKIVEPDERYQHGTNLLECLYGAPEISAMQTSVSSTRAKSRVLMQNVTTTYDAELDTTLGTLGLSGNGTAIFNVRGENRTVNVTTNTTLDGLITLLKNQGIFASFDEDTHRFSVENATLTGGTSNLSSVLGMTTTVSGKYKTSTELYAQETVTIDATEDTILGDFGITSSMTNAQKTVTVYSSDGTSLGSTVVSQNTKVGDLLDFINSKTGVTANITDGVITIHNGYIQNATLEEAMGLEHSNKSSYVLGSIMTHTTISSVTQDTTLSNIFDTLGTSNKVSGGYNLYFNSQALDVNANTTLNGLIAQVYAHGGTASVDSLGRLSIDGETLTGTVADALGIVSVTNTASVGATGEDLYTTQTVYADLNTQLKDLGLNSSSIIVHNTLGAAVTTINFTGTNSLSDVFAQLKANGIDATITNGVISLTSAEEKYITGNLADTFGISTQTVTSVANTTSYSTASITHTGLVIATLSSTLGEVGAITEANQTFEIYREDGTCLATINNLTTSSTVGDLFARLEAYGIQASLDDGVVNLYSPSGNYATGTIMTNIGISTQTGVSKTYTIAKTTSSSVAITFTSDVNATESDKISDFITLPNNKTITIYDKNNNSIGTFDVDSNTTFSDLFAALGQKGIVGSMNDGVITLTPSDGQYATGDVLTRLNLNTTSVVGTMTVGQSCTGSTISYTTTHTAQGDTTLATVGINQNASITVKNSQNGAILGSFNVTGTTTFNQLSQSLDAYGMTMSIVDGVIHLDSDTAYAEGSILASLGISTTATTTTVTTTIAKAVTGTAAVTYTTTTTATGETTLGQVGISAGWITIKNAETSQVIGSFNVETTTTFNSLINSLDNYGINASVVDGIFRVASGDAYAEGDPLTALGIGVSDVTTTVSTVVTTKGNDCSGSSVTYSVTNTAVGSTTLQTVYLNNNSYDITIKNAQTGASIATFSVAKTETFDSLASKLGNYGISAEMVDGIFRISSGDNYADASTLFTPLGISNMTVTTTVGTTVTTHGQAATGSTANYSYYTWATEDTKISDTGLNAVDPTITIKNAFNGTTVATITTNADTTFRDLANALGAYGIVAGITDGVFFMGSDNTYATGGVLNELGVGVESKTLTQTVTGTTSTTTVGRTATGTRGVRMLYAMPKAMTGTNTLLVNATVAIEHTGSTGVSVSYSTTITNPTGVTGSTGVMFTYTQTVTTTDTISYSTVVTNPMAVTGSTSYMFTYTQTVTTTDTVTNPTGITGSSGVMFTYTQTTTATVTNPCAVTGSSGVMFTYTQTTTGTSTVTVGVATESSDAFIKTVTQTTTATVTNPAAITGSNLVTYNGTVGGSYTSPSGAFNTTTVTTTTPQAVTGTNGIMYTYAVTGTIPQGTSSGVNTVKSGTTMSTMLYDANAGGPQIYYNDSATIIVHSTNGGADSSFVVHAANTFQYLAKELHSRGIDLELDGTTVRTFTDGEHYVEVKNVNMNSAFTPFLYYSVFGGANGGTYTTTSDKVATTNITFRKAIVTNGGGTFANSDKGYITLKNSSTGTSYTITVSGSTTISATLTELANKGIDYYITDDFKLALDPNGNWYIYGMSDTLKTGFGITVGNGNTYSTVKNTQTSPITLDTYIVQTAASSVYTLYTTVIDSKTGTVVASNMSYLGNGMMEGFATWRELANWLADYGIDMDINSEGKLVINSTGDNYVELSTSAAGANPLSAFGITGWNGISNAVSGTVIPNNNTKLSELGIDQNVIFTIKNANTGATSYFTFTSDSTMVDIGNTLAENGPNIFMSITDQGGLVFDPNGDWYIHDITAAFKTKFGLTTGAGNSWVTDTVTRTTTHTEPMALSEISMVQWVNNYTIQLKSTDTGSTVNIVVNSTTNNTAEKLKDTLASYSIDVSVDSEGHLVCTPLGDYYIYSGGGSQSTDYGLFGFNNHNPYTIEIRTVTTTTTHEVPPSMSTKLSDLGINENVVFTFQFITGGDAAGSSFTFTFAPSKTLGDIATALTGNSGVPGITMSITDNGSLVFDQESGYLFISDITASFKNKFGLQTGLNKSYVTDTVTRTTTHTEPVKTNQTLAQCNINSNVIFTVKNASTGATQYLTFASSKTLGEVATGLNGYSIQMTIQDNGSLTFDPNGDWYIQDITAAFKTKFGLTTGAGNSWVTDTVTRTSTVTHTEPIHWDQTFAGVTGVANNAQIKLELKHTNGTLATISVSGSSTFQNLKDALSPYGITMNITDAGRVVFDAKGEYFITADISSNPTDFFSSKFGMTFGNGNSWYQDTVSYSTTVYNTRTTTYTDPIDLSQTFANAGINQAFYITLQNAATGSLATITMQGSSTLQNLKDQMSAKNIDMNITDIGSLSFSPSGDWLIKDATEAFKNKFGLTFGLNHSYYTDTVARTEAVNIYTAVNKVDGFAGGNIVLTNITTGATTTIAYSNSGTFATIASNLSNNGITMSFDNTGHLVLTPTGANYVSNVTGGLKDKFGFNCGENVTYRKYNTSFDMSTPLTSVGLTGTTKYYITLKNDKTNQTTSVYVQGSESLTTLQNRLNAYDIELNTGDNGNLVISAKGDWYVNGMDNTFAAIFGLSTGEENSFTYMTWTDADRTLNQLTGQNITTDQYMTIVNSETGASNRITITGEDTISSIDQKLSTYGISAYTSVQNDGNGYLTLATRGKNYITSMPTILANAFDINAGEGNTFWTVTHDVPSRVLETTITANTTSSNILTHNVTGTIDGNSRLSTITGSNDNIVVKNGVTNVTSTILISGNMTVDSVMAALGAYDIAASLNGGVMSVNPAGDWYIQTAGALAKFSIGASSTTTSTTHDVRTITENKTGTSVKTWNTTPYIDGNTKLSQFGATGNIVVKHGINGDEHTINTSNMTVDGLMSALSAYGIQANLSNTGTLSLDFNDVYYIETAGALSTFGLTLITSTTETTYDTHTEKVNTSGDTVRSYNTTLNVNWTTTFNQLGMAENATSDIILSNNGQLATIKVSSSNTLSEVAQELGNYGISTTLNNGVVTTGAGSHWSISSAGPLNAYLKMSNNANDYRTTTTSYTTVGTNHTDGRTFTHTTTDAMSGDSTFAQIGQTANTTVTIKNKANATAGTIAITSGMTVNDFLTAASAYGIAGTISSDGKLNLQFNDENYFSDDTNTTNLLAKLGITGTNTRTPHETTVKSNTTSGVQHHTVTTSMTSDTTLAALGLSADATVTVGREGVNGAMAYATITVNTTQTVGDLVSTLGGLGVSASVKDGKFILQGGTKDFVTAMDNSLKTALKIDVGNNVSYEQKTSGTTTNTDSNDLVMTKNTLLIDGSTVLNTINDWSNGDGKLVVHKTDGQFETISVNGSGTVDDFFRQIAAFGLNGTVGEDGKVTVLGTGNVYLQSVSGGSNILTSLKMSNVTTQVETVTSNRTSSALQHTVTVAATGTTKLKDLESVSGSGITFSGDNVNLVLSTTSDAGNESITLTFSKNNTLYDVINSLASHGITASIDAMGRFSMTSSTLNDFDVSGALGTFLMGSYTKEYGTDTTYNVSTNLMQKTIVNMTDDTLLSKLNVTNGNFEITQEGVKYTVNISNTSTVGDFRNLLARYGINSYIDDEGHLTAFGVGETWLDSVAGGSNIVSKFGLDKNKWSLGEITQTSNDLTDTTVLTDKTTWDRKLSELTNSAGTNLGITSGDVFVYQDGTRSTLHIDRDDTLQTLSSKLSQYGITMGLSSDGKVYFDGTNDSYITNASSNSSNILTQLAVNGDWNTRYDSESQNLNYNVTSNSGLLRSTKLVDLQDTDGNNLGVTTGTYYIYEDGVRNTETITEDTTVNDLMASMAKYGLIADIDESGSISVSGHNNSFMQTSSLMGANSNIVESLFNSSWEFTNIYTSNHLEAPKPEIRAITRETKLADIAEGDYQAGNITVTKDGIQSNIALTANDTVGTFMDELSMYGFDAVINDNGQLILRASGDSQLSAGSTSAGYSNALSILGVEASKWIQTNNYDGSELNVTKYSTATVAVTRDTALDQIKVDSSHYVSTGEFNIYKNGVKYTALISSDETVGTLMDTLRNFGVETSLVDGKLQLVGSGDTYIAKSLSVNNASNISDLFVNKDHTNAYSGLEQTKSFVTTQTEATENTTISEINQENSKDYTGAVAVNINGTTSTLNIEQNDTIGTVLNKFRAIGLEATISNGQILVQSGYDTLNVTSTNSAIVSGANSLFTFVQDLGKDHGVQGFSASNATVTYEKTITDELSASKYADMDTKLSLLNVSEGTLSVYRNGKKAQLTIGADETFNSLQSQLNANYGNDVVKLSFTEDGFLNISSDGAEVIVGATNDTSNFSSITGIAADGSGKSVSARELYCVNGESKIVNEGMFRRGTVNEGTFKVGNADITINSDTTLNDIIAQINNNEASQATAYWDNVSGKLLITSNKSGSTYVNIEAGTSNFTDIMGYTESTWGSDGILNDTKMNVKAQTVGTNAKFSINGTSYTSTSNTISSDISRIEGVTIDLKKVSEGESVTLTIQKDTEVLANAVSDAVDSYNELMSNLEDQLGKEGALSKETTLKMIKEQLRNIMSGAMKNIGINTDAAAAGNVATSFSAITKLTFDKDKFMKEYKANPNYIKTLLVGTENDYSTGVFSRLESAIENAVEGTGYFTSTEKSYQTKISNLNTKIKKANLSLERYRAMLEKKFSAMDRLIAQMNQQYSSFLTT